MKLSPLTGKRILLTRAEHQLTEVDRMLRDRGAVPIHFPCLALEPLPHEIDQALPLLEKCSDVLFTSSNGVLALQRFCHDRNRDPALLLAGKRIAAVGDSTAETLRALAINVQIIPNTASQHGLIEAYAVHGMPERLLFYRAEEGSDVLAANLRKQGVEVDTVKAYRTICPQGSAVEIVSMIAAGEIDAVLLGSAKTARHYLQRIGSGRVANAPVVAVISPAMADEAERSGLHVQVVAKTASFEAMLDALADYFDANPS
ncbi:uroporphyrinogen-III synthase/uroporphyrinogen III methyltransferase [Mariprofundus ferrinatatus]|uniref:Uroporphyrinogen-III synthase/uroporphyrinogen III methyltransferase n=2 Tax=Mariprofundus ferrinatatus TaxID=1921087 RepID=A0A2K8LF19_9PROT|nr:uroporphyrinogen-III synthase/uroporphyrinogen III methyltransferase [Mariprofundus ferrinatatus]